MNLVPSGWTSAVTRRRCTYPRRARSDAEHLAAVADPGYVDDQLALVEPLRQPANDAWHVFRAGTSLDELSAVLSTEHVFGVELNDAATEVVGTLFEDTVERRLLCGAGSFDLHGLVALLRDTGFDGPWGVEILSEAFRALPVQETLKLAAESALTVL